MNTYTETLRQYNLKATPQRLAILQIINKHGHINIDTLYNEVKDQFNSISLATVYKNITSMTAVKLLIEVKLANAKSVYEIIKEDHAHLKCEICTNIEDFTIDTNNLFDNTSNLHSFRINYVNITLNGICKNCQ
jgi:Fur family peroxide stress response transcriptional regulator